MAVDVLELEVEPTNNASERALRHAVIWRKLSFGTQSAGGSRFFETMLTVIETCRQQSRNVFAYVTVADQAHFARQTMPSLLPESRTIALRGRGKRARPCLLPAPPGPAVETPAATGYGWARGVGDVLGARDIPPDVGAPVVAPA